MQRLLTCDEVMKKLQITSKNTMSKLIKSTGFPAYKIGGIIRIGEDELEEWIKKQKIKG